jgi:uncharacterized alkaline shock family protein YloU
MAERGEQGVVERSDSAGSATMLSDEAVDGERGRTVIGDNVVAKISGVAASEVPGVHAMGSGISRTFGAVRSRVPGGRPNAAQGVSVEVGERQTAIDLDIVVEYGVSIADLAMIVRENVINSVERMTGLEVVEVNISVADIHLPDDDAGDAGQAGGQARIQ